MYSKEKNFFNSLPVLLVETNNQKTLNIPIKNKNIEYNSKYISKSWDESTRTIDESSRTINKIQIDNTENSPRESINIYKSKNDKRKYSIINHSMSPIDEYFLDKTRNKFNKDYLENYTNDNYIFKSYDAITNCKSAGIIPYSIYNGKLYFLLQQSVNPLRKKDYGWNDFGGKKIDPKENTSETAAREFSEETSCLFYLKEQNNDESKKLYDILKDNQELYYDDETISNLKKLIPISQKYFADKITEYVLPIYVSSKETYISYFIRVEYIPEKDLPRAEDIHIPYEYRYIRMCKWFTFDELMNIDEKDFHKRLQITRIKQRINNYHDKGLFT